MRKSYSLFWVAKTAQRWESTRSGRPFIQNKTKMKEQDYLEQELALVEQGIDECNLSDSEKLKKLSERKQKLLMRLWKYVPLFT